MKRFLISIVVLAGFVVPLLAQVDHDVNPNDRVPLINTTITKDQVPAAVLNAVNTKFNLKDVKTWSKFPYALKEYGWVYDQASEDMKLNRYEVTMKTQNGGELWAVYGANGDLIETNELNVNVELPQSVMESLSKSQYKDWKVVGNKEIIKYYHDHNESSVEQHYRITVEKDKVRKSISFNYQTSTKK
jgi:hypothetical protein